MGLTTTTSRMEPEAPGMSAWSHSGGVGESHSHASASMPVEGSSESPSSSTGPPPLPPWGLPRAPSASESTQDDSAPSPAEPSARPYRKALRDKYRRPQEAYALQPSPRASPRVAAQDHLEPLPVSALELLPPLSVTEAPEVHDDVARVYNPTLVPILVEESPLAEAEPVTIPVSPPGLSTSTPPGLSTSTPPGLSLSMQDVDMLGPSTSSAAKRFAEDPVAETQPAPKKARKEAVEETLLIAVAPTIPAPAPDTAPIPTPAPAPTIKDVPNEVKAALSPVDSSKHGKPTNASDPPPTPSSSKQSIEVEDPSTSVPTPSAKPRAKPPQAKAKPAKNVANAPKKVDNAPTASSSKTPAKSKKPTGTQADDTSTASSSKTPAKSKNSTETPADHGSSKTPAKSKKSSEPQPTPRSRSKLWVPEVQYARCMSTKYKDIPFSRCVSCTRRWAGDTCRFQNLRYFLKDKAEDNYPAFAFAEYHHTRPIRSKHEYPQSWNVNLTIEHIQKMKRTVAKALLPILLKEKEHVESKATIFRVREHDVRATCDTCMTSLFAGTWMCRLCGREVCGDCYERIKEVTYLPDPKNATDAQKKALALRREQLGNTCINLSCSKKREHSNADFTPLTRFEQTELDKAIRGMKDIIKEEATHKQDAAQKPAITSFMSRTPPDNVRTLAAPTHRTPYFHVNELKPEVFQYLWSQGEPLVVGGLLPHMQQSWTPDFFTTDPIKSEECTLVECQSNTTKKTTVRAFFSTFGDYEGRSEVWKLKDWPSTTEFKEVFPQLFDDFCNIVPIPDYVRPNGVSNVASFFPTNCLAPDLGPKMYNAQATTDKRGSQGSTKLHMDMSDAINIMAYASDTVAGGPGYAIWDIFKASDAQELRMFMRRKLDIKSTLDPIHTQRWYLDSNTLDELHQETGIKSYRLYQRPGEAVFIPAGCAHQVANMADCIKAAIDFVSPENITRCERLTTEFQEQNESRVWKEDVLQLRTMMWFAWQSCCQQESALSEDN